MLKVVFIVVALLVACRAAPPACPTPPDPHARAIAELTPLYKEANARKAAIATPGDLSDRAWVKRVLHEMAQVDQLVRAKWNWPAEQKMDKPGTEFFMVSLVYLALDVDAHNLALLRRLVAKYGWFAARDWDKETERNAWLLVQHADTDPGFQREILTVMEPLVATKDVSPESYALLFDRVARAESRPQRYGTQGECKNRTWIAFPVEDPAQLDRRRGEVGLPPMAQYVTQISPQLCP
jgi:hypothetical protein